MLENNTLRKEEEKNNSGFVEKLAAPFHLFLNNAYGTTHHAVHLMLLENAGGAFSRYFRQQSDSIGRIEVESDVINNERGEGNQGRSVGNPFLAVT